MKAMRSALTAGSARRRVSVMLGSAAAMADIPRRSEKRRSARRFIRTSTEELFAGRTISGEGPSKCGRRRPVDSDRRVEWEVQGDAERPIDLAHQGVRQGG